MVISEKNATHKVMKNLRGGNGSVLAREILGTGELGGHGSMYAYITLEPGVSIGYHQHVGDSEAYFILSGTGLYSDNGNPVTIGPGDMTWCPDGEHHGLENNGTEPIVMIALILYTGLKN